MTPDGGHGGGILNEDASLTVEDSTVANNVSSNGYYGGGIYNSAVFDADTFRLIRTNVSGNRCVGPCDGGGGGVTYFDSSESDVFEIRDSVIQNNVVDGGDGGGGIYAEGGTFDPVDRFEMTGTTIRGNSATGGWGGGLALWWGQNATIKDSTISGNESHWGVGNDPPQYGWGGSGGGALLSGTVQMTNTTVSNNLASADPATTDEPGGGGIYNDIQLYLDNVTLSGNRALQGGNISNSYELEMSGTVVTDGVNSDSCFDTEYGTSVSNGHNLDSGDSCNFDQPTDQTDTDPLLGPLQDNGGPTKTHALQPGSPAIDAGGDYCPPEDQRGVSRMHDGDGDGNALCDIGAFELEGSSPPVPPTTGKLGVEASAPENLLIDNGALNPNPFTVDAIVRYEGYTQVESVTATLSTSPEGLTVEGEPTISIGAMNPGEERRVTWQVEAPLRDEQQDYALKVEVETPDLSTATDSRQITVPPRQDSGSPPGPEPDPEVSDEFGVPQDPNATGGDPVNFVTGNMYETTEDLNLPGKGFPLQFVRTYNSQDTIEGPLGYGWTYSYNTRLKENPDGSITEIDPEGKRLVFKKNPDGSYTAPAGYEDTLTKQTGGSSTTPPGFTLEKKNGFVWSFGSGGRLKEITDPNGNAITFSYTSDNLTRITDTADRDIILSYNAEGRITSLTDPSSKSITYAYDDTGNLASVTDRDGEEIRYTYAAAGGPYNLTRVIDKDGSTFSFTYDEEDRVSSTVGEDGTYKMTLSYNKADRETTVTDSKGNESVFFYNAMKRVTKVVDPLGNQRTYTFDEDGNRTSETDELGNTTGYAYDDKSNLTEIDYPTGVTWQATYGEPYNSLKTETDPAGETTAYAYDDNGNPTTVTDALGEKTTLEYDASGQPTRTVDAEGRATTYTYDSKGNLTSLADPEGNETDYSYGPLGRVTQTTDALGRSTAIERDALGRVTGVTHPGGATESFGYDATGNPASYSDERGETWTSTYNGTDKVTSETDPLGNKTTYAYDTEANLTSVTDPEGNETVLEYDPLTRLTGMTLPDGTADGATTTYAYDAAGRMSSTTDPKGKTTSYAYDPIDRLTGVTDAAGGEASYDYDAVGRLTRAVNPNGHARSYAYDALGRLTRETDPLERTRSYAYDSVGNVTGRTDSRGRETTYAYDALDRLTRTSYPDASTEELSYDAVSNLTTLTDKIGTTDYTYDKRDRLVREASPQGTTEHAYDAAGNRTALTYPGASSGTAGGAARKATYAFDAANRMTSATSPAGAETTYAYDKLDRLTETSYPTGAGEAFTYDPLGRVTAARATGPASTDPASTDPASTDPASTVLKELTYAYDKNSNVTSITDREGTDQDGEQSTYAYDALDRLTKETHRYRSYGYTYDAAGNRTTLEMTTPNGTKTTGYRYDAAEQMTKAGNTTYSYDENGNLTSKTLGESTTDYAYDYEDRLIGTGSASYTYDAFGRKVTSQVGEKETGYLYDGTEAIQEKSTGADAATLETATTYLRGPAARLVSREQEGSESQSYYHHDRLGSVTALSGGGGTLTDTYGYTAFGTPNERSGESEQPYSYLANAYDPATKLYDFHARHYDASVGRFTSEDPVEGVASVPQTLNPYIYGTNNPYSSPDPDGEIIPLVVAGALIGSAVGAGSYAAIAEDPTWRGALGAAAGGAVVGGVAPIAVPAATAVGGGATTVAGINAAAGVGGAGLSAALDPDKELTFQSATLGAASAGIGGGISNAAFRTIGMKNFKQVGFPRTWRGVTPRFLGGKAGPNARNALYNPTSVSGAFGFGTELFTRKDWLVSKEYYLNDRANKDGNSQRP